MEFDNEIQYLLIPAPPDVRTGAVFEPVILSNLTRSAQ
jgi:hypothetical protein